MRRFSTEYTMSCATCGSSSTPKTTAQKAVAKGHSAKGSLKTVEETIARYISAPGTGIPGGWSLRYPWTGGIIISEGSPYEIVERIVITLRANGEPADFANITEWALRHVWLHRAGPTRWKTEKSARRMIRGPFKNKGPGTELRKLLHKVGIEPRGEECKCNEHMHEMDDNGIEWCVTNTGIILDWLQEEAAKRPILGRLFVRSLAKMVVERAIASAIKAEEESQAKTETP
jgi:hypothetical protein